MRSLKNKKELVARLAKVGSKRIKFDPTRLKDIKEAITKTDVRSLINDGAIKILPKRGISKSRIRKNIIQKRKGRKKGKGSRKGKRTARLSKKNAWKQRVRLQREFIQNCRDKKLITTKTYQNAYRKIKGGFFRSKRHIKLYLNEQGLIEEKKK